MDMSSADAASTKLLSLTQRSASEDLGCRRGEFSRKHYGSVELLISSDADGAIQRAGRFRVENGSSDENSDCTPGTWHRTDVHLENPEYHTRWYFKYFLGKVHQNYVGTDTEKNPFFLSVVLSDQNNQRVPQYRAILWKKTGTQKICLPYSPTKTLSVKSILSAMNLDKFEKGPREIFTPEIQKDLLVLEEQEGSVNFKFGVLYAKDGQLTDDEMFSNETGSEGFQKFLNLMGESITLKGWIGYRGGLDTKNDTTGIHSIYTVYQGHEIMFHVSTMLPYSKENKQQVERKRHIGNDIVTMVFQEGEDSSPAFKPSMIRSHFTHIFALVRYNKQNDSYRLKIFSEESVPLFGPPLPTPPVFTDHHEFRDFVLVKLINGEKATLETPTFSQKRQRTLDMLIRSLYQDLIPDLHKEMNEIQLGWITNMLNRRSFSDVLPESPKSARKKEEARQAEFVRVGQALKLKTIVRGDAPTSLVTTGLCRKEVSEISTPLPPLQMFTWMMPQRSQRLSKARGFASAFDHWLLLFHAEGQTPVPVFDRTLSVKQMDILETQDLFLSRVDKGKDARLFVFRLSSIKKALEERQMVKSKSDCKDNRLEKTKGCHLYAINTHHGNELRIVVAIRNKLLLITRKTINRSDSFPILPPPTDSPVEDFQYIREICLCDPAAVMTLVDGPTGDNDNLICVAYRHQFDLVNESTGETYRLHHVDASKVTFVAAIDVYEDGEAGLLLCYNYVCYYKKVCPFNGGSPLVQPSPSDFHFCWNQVPNSIENTTQTTSTTAVMLELHLTASQSDIYFTSAASSMNAASGGSSRDASSQSSPQTPTGQEMPVLPSSQGEGKLQHVSPLEDTMGI
ncbi:GTPase-activating Rap/Ran-GAP domain-like protein 3 [Leucoraja erinacea]|uniref:GTPase-activating Rap/Ran-GAP domain-like protein 3 n=1 Tax=Leucoraja erinaceus TaxID=7782 RepID=UPI0024564DE9|nr:GTPase-activating Rap/Ran-GAP domain-like protein 3 [Leucoraja erinacea]